MSNVFARVYIFLVINVMFKAILAFVIICIAMVSFTFPIKWHFLQKLCNAIVLFCRDFRRIVKSHICKMHFIYCMWWSFLQSTLFIAWPYGFQMVGIWNRFLKNKNKFVRLPYTSHNKTIITHYGVDNSNKL